MTKREEESALKHPPQHHPLLSLCPSTSSFISSSLGLADQFPLDIDYCYNCTVLITCSLESLSLSLFRAALAALHFLHLFPSQLAYISEQVSLCGDYNPSIVCVRQEVISNLLPLCDPRGHKSSNGLVLYIFYYLLISVIIIRCLGGALRANLCLLICLCTHV